MLVYLEAHRLVYLEGGPSCADGKCILHALRLTSLCMLGAGDSRLGADVPLYLESSSLVKTG